MRSRNGPGIRLGIYADLLYRRDGEGVSTDRAFVLFLAGLAERLDELVVFGRLAPEPGRAPYGLPASVRFVPLPYYPRTSDLRNVGRALAGSRTAFSRELGGLDAAWLFGPHPVSLAFAALARRRGVPVVLGVRQELPRYAAGRLPWALPVAHGLEAAFRLLARRVPSVVVGDALAERYRGGRAPVLATGLSLVRRGDLVPVEDALARAWDGELRLVTVSRLDPEKNPLLLADVLARLRSRDARWRLTVVGRGPLDAALARRADELGIGGALELAGYVRHGPELSRRYREANAFLHVSLTEGLPQVLFEAQAAGLPVVATAVGGIPAALGHGRTGLLVPPRDAEAAALALERLRDDAALRERLVRAGLERAAAETMDAQLDRLVAFFAETLG